jgi:exosortase A
MTAVAFPETSPIAAKAWLRHGAALAVLLLAILAAFHNSVAAAVTVWWVSPTYSHCFLIIPIVLWLVWEKRAALALLTPSLCPQALILVPLLALMWWMGDLSAINEVQQYAVVGMMQAMIVALLGIPVVRLIWFPVLYLLFLVPTGEYLIVPMQHFATRFVDVSLTLLNIPHYTEGTTFELTTGRFEIAEACAGLRFLIATVTLGVLFSYMMFRKLYKTILFLIACAGVPLIGNGLRCVGIIVLAYFTNNEYGAGADHIVYGWGFNIAILVVLGVLGSFFRDDFEEKTEIKPGPTAPPAKLMMATAIALFLIATGPAVAWWHDNYFAQPDLAALDGVFRASGGQDTSASAWRPEFSGLDARARAVAELGPVGERVDMYLGYYARPRPGHSMAAHVNHFWNNGWTLSDSGNIAAKLGNRTIRLQEWVIASPAERRLVWSTYWVDGRFVTSLFRLKLLQVAAVLQGHEGQAVIVFSTATEGTLEEARRRLAQALKDQSQLPAKLEQANRRAPAGGAP